MKPIRSLALAAVAVGLAALTAGEAAAGPFVYRGHHNRWDHGYSAYPPAGAYYGSSGYVVTPGYAPGYYPPLAYPAGGYVLPGYGHGTAYFGGPPVHHGTGYYGYGHQGYGHHAHHR